jgi:RNA polymerase sigma-B factor
VTALIADPQKLDRSETDRQSTPSSREANHRRRSELTSQLFRRIADIDDENEQNRLRQEAVLVNMPVAEGVAGRYRGRGVAQEDLEQVAYLGLVKAAERFDLKHGSDFLTFAVPTVSGEVKRYFRDLGWVVRPPRRIQELQASITAAAGQLAQQLGRSAKPSEVAGALGIHVEEVVEALSADGAFTPGSLDVPVGEDGTDTVGDFVTTETHDLDRAEARMMLGPAVRELAPRDRLIVECRFFRGWTQQEIADQIGVTQMQVSRLLARILSDLRQLVAA